MKQSVHSNTRHEKPGSPLSSTQEQSNLRFAFYAIGALIVVLTLAYIDGGEEPLHKIVHPVAQSVSPAAGSEQQS